MPPACASKSRTFFPARACRAVAAAKGRRRDRLTCGCRLVLRWALGRVVIVHFREAPPAAAPEMRTEIVTPSTTRSGVFCAFAGRAADRVCGLGRRDTTAVAAAAGRDIGAAAGGDRGRELSLLVARQPVGGLLCRWQAEAHRHRGRIAADAGRRRAIAAERGVRTEPSCLRGLLAARCFASPPREASRWR